MLTKLTVRNFKSLDNVMFEFQPINLFIGPNSSGKSTALQAIEVLHALTRPSITDFFAKEKGWDYRDLPHRKNLTRTMGFEAEFSFDAACRYLVELQPRLHLGIGRECVELDLGDGSRMLLDRTGRKTEIYDEMEDRKETETLRSLPCSAMQGLKDKNGSFSHLLMLRSFLERFQSFLLWNPKDLRRPHQGLAERLGPSGEGLPGLWAYLQRKEPAKAKELLALLQRVFPKIAAIQSAGKAGWAWHHLHITERIGGKLIQYPAEQAGDGFLRMPALFSLKYLPDPPRMITLEEPENGVHPQLISRVIDHLKELSDRRGPDRIQVFMTSHSPYVLNEFADRPECVHIFEKGQADAVPRIIPLREREQVIRASEGLGRSLGDLWYSNLLGGEIAPIKHG